MSGVESKLESGLALITWHQRQVNLLGDELEAAINLVLAPPSHVTPAPGTIAEDVVKLVVTGGQTGGVDVGEAQVNVPVSVEKGDVIAQSSLVELRMFQDSDDSVLFMVELFRTIKTTGIPFSNTYFQ